jgi:hypothetical protein
MRAALFPVTKIQFPTLRLASIFDGSEHQLVSSVTIRMHPNMRRDFALLRSLDHVHSWLVSLPAARRQWNADPNFNFRHKLF